MADIDSNSLNNFVTALNKASKSLGDMQKAVDATTKSAKDAGKAADASTKNAQAASTTPKTIQDAAKKIQDDFSKDVLAAFDADGKAATKARMKTRDELYTNLKHGLADTTTSGLGEFAYRFHGKTGLAGAFIAGYTKPEATVGTNVGAASSGAAQGDSAKAGGATDGTPKSESDIARSTDFLTGLATQAGEKIRGALGGMLFDALDGNFKNIGKSFRTMLRQMLADAAASQISKLATGVLSWVGSAIGGMFATNTNFSTGWPGQSGANILGGDTYAGAGSMSIGWGSAGKFAQGSVFAHGAAVHAFARGGVVNNPTLFPMATGTGLMGEAGPEAIMPLARGPDGRLGVRSSRGGSAGGVNNQISITVNVGGNGNAQSDTQAQSDDAGRQLAAMVESKVKEVMTREQRQGGILWRMQHA